MVTNILGHSFSNIFPDDKAYFFITEKHGAGTGSDSDLLNCLGSLVFFFGK